MLLLVGLVFGLSGCSLFNRGPDIQNWQPGVSPESQNIVFASKADGNFQLFLLNPETGEKTQLTNNDFDDWGADWGPDGKRIVYVSQRDDNTDIYMLDTESGDEVRLTTDPGQDVNPKWSGKDTVIFNSDRTDLWEIFELSVSDNSLNQLTSSSSEGSE